jgi:plasmid stability protein
MATLKIQNLPDDLYHQIQELALQQNKPFDEQVIHLLRDALQSTSRASVLENQSEWELAKAYQLASEEIDPIWENTIADGLTDET